MNGNLRIRSIVKQSRRIVECAELPATARAVVSAVLSGQRVTRRHARAGARRTAHATAAAKFAPRDFIGLALENETFLAGQTGALLLFVVGFCCRGPNELDRCPQLHCAE